MSEAPITFKTKSKINFTETPEPTILLSGSLDENFPYSELVRYLNQNLTIDFSGIYKCNSRGVLEWSKLLQLNNSKILYVHVPVFIVDQFQTVPEFFGKKSELKTFYIAVSCSSCEKEETIFCDKQKLLTIIALNSTHQEVLLDTNCRFCFHNEMILDGNLEDFKKLFSN